MTAARTAPAQPAAGPCPDGPVLRLNRPYDQAKLYAAMRTQGAVVLAAAISPETCARVDTDVAGYLRRHGGPGLAPAVTATGDADLRNGPHGLAVHNLVGKIDSIVDVIGNPDVLRFTRRMLAPLSAVIRLGAADYLERHPGEPRPADGPTGWHRATDTWPDLAVGRHPVAVSAIVPLVPFTPANGAIWLSPGSHHTPHQLPDAGPSTQVSALTGDVILLRADLAHSAGHNCESDRPRRTLSIGYQVDWLPPRRNSRNQAAARPGEHFPAGLHELLAH